jgi:hypothetical protein
MPLSREPFFLRMAIWFSVGVPGSVAIGRGFEPQSDLELFSAKIISIIIIIHDMGNTW